MTLGKLAEAFALAETPPRLTPAPSPTLVPSPASHRSQAGDSGRPPATSIWYFLVPLIDAGLVEIEGDAVDVSTRTVRATKQLGAIQSLLGISLRKLQQEHERLVLRVNPFHGIPPGYPTLKANQVFVLAEFTEDSLELYRHILKPACSRVGLCCARADDFFANGVIMQQVWEAILGAEVIIADCTHKNANVFYEMGIAHTLGKQTILITQSVEDLPFDLRHVRAITYDYTPAGIRKLGERLVQTLTSVLNLASTSVSSTPVRTRDTRHFAPELVDED